MKLVITGAAGQLGRAVVAEASRRGIDAVGTTRESMPIDDAGAVAEFIAAERPDGVVHCAAWTDVDGCETDVARAEACNGRAPGYVVDACRAVGARLAHVSTDYVFDGSRKASYRPSDPTSPTSSYGRTKRDGEVAVMESGLARWWVVRTSWVFGPGGKNFPKAILNRARDGGPLKVVDDQVGSPTLTLDLADALLDLIQSDADSAILHAANDGACSWHALAEEVLRVAGIDMPIAKATSEEILKDRPAPRPAWSVLDCSDLARLRGRPMPTWYDAVRRWYDEEENSQ